MTAHLHGTFIEGCYRCDLSRDEASAVDEGDEMCPNCVTPWKCNGPHDPGA